MRFRVRLWPPFWSTTRVRWGRPMADKEMGPERANAQTPNECGLSGPHFVDIDIESEAQAFGYALQATDHAMCLALQGTPVFPCQQNKRPYTENGFKAATTDTDTIMAWWMQWPEALIGVPTGVTFVVLDL